MTRAACRLLLNVSTLRLSWRSMKTLRHSQIDLEVLQLWSLLAFHTTVITPLEAYLSIFVPFYYYFQFLLLLATFIPGTKVPNFLFHAVLVPGMDKVHDALDVDVWVAVEWMLWEVKVLPLKLVDWLFLPGVVWYYDAVEEEEGLDGKEGEEQRRRRASLEGVEDEGDDDDAHFRSSSPGERLDFEDDSDEDDAAATDEAGDAMADEDSAAADDKKATGAVAATEVDDALAADEDAAADCDMEEVDADDGGDGTAVQGQGRDRVAGVDETAAAAAPSPEITVGGGATMEIEDDDGGAEETTVAMGTDASCDASTTSPSLETWKPVLRNRRRRPPPKPTDGTSRRVALGTRTNLSEDYSPSSSKQQRRSRPLRSAPKSSYSSLASPVARSRLHASSLHLRQFTRDHGGNSPGSSPSTGSSSGGSSSSPGEESSETSTGVSPSSSESTKCSGGSVSNCSPNTPSSSSSLGGGDSTSSSRSSSPFDDSASAASPSHSQGRTRGPRPSIGDSIRTLLTGDCNIRVRDHLFDLDLPAVPPPAHVCGSPRIVGRGASPESSSPRSADRGRRRGQRKKRLRSDGFGVQQHDENRRRSTGGMVLLQRRGSSNDVVSRTSLKNSGGSAGMDSTTAGAAEQGRDMRSHAAQQSGGSTQVGSASGSGRSSNVTLRRSRRLQARKA